MQSFRQWLAESAEALLRQIRTLTPVSSIQSLPRPKFVLPDGSMWTGNKDYTQTHEEILNELGLDLQAVLRAGVVRLMITRGVLDGFSIGARLSSTLADIMLASVDFEQQGVFVDVLVANNQYDSNHGRLRTADAVRTWINGHF